MKNNSTDTPMMSLESVCQYACSITDDHEANVISQMMMAQYMLQGLSDQPLVELILSIPERRRKIRRDEERAHPPRSTSKETPGPVPVVSPNTSHLPPNLRTPAAIAIWQTLYREALVDEHCQTLCSRTESGLMAAHIAKALGIRNVWVTFDSLWGISNLKSAHDKALDFESCWNFKAKLDALIPINQ